MNKNVIISTVVGAVALYILGYIIWEMLMADFFAANEGTATGVDRDTMILWPQIVAALLYGYGLTLAVQSKGSGASVMDGVMAGAVVGVVIWGTADFALYSFQNVSTLTGVIADTALEAVRGGIVGAVLVVTMSKISS